MSATNTEAPVRFSANALAELRRMMSEPDFNPSHRLRIGVKGGGCAGLSYILSFEAPDAADELFDIEGIPCIIHPAQALYLFGMEVDWASGLNARGFEFKNPNASSTCGCGTSFAV